MSDPNDPYNRPPAPERFQPPVPTEETRSRQLEEPAEPLTRSAEPAIPERPVDVYPGYEDRAPRAEALPALEPLPVLAGDFGAPTRAEGGDGASLSSRLVDEFVAWLKTLASAAVYATLIVTFGFQVARVEGQSMAPTLQDQDRLIVNKFAYLTHIGEPQVDDIVMLYYPNNPKKSFVKRVIAAEGQMVKMVNGKVFVDDEEVNDSYVPEEYRGHEDYGPQRIPEGYYFVMGDHRNNSSDSRHWGFVPKKYIIGRVQLRWWPVPEARTF
ncbi:hypothetical protein BH24ACI5_BH24ACI5_19660 [soil metagenome]